MKMPPGPIAGPSAWYGRDMTRREDQWLQRPLPEVFASRYGSVVPGARGGIVVGGTVLKVPLEAE